MSTEFDDMATAASPRPSKSLTSPTTASARHHLELNYQPVMWVDRHESCIRRRTEDLGLLLGGINRQLQFNDEVNHLGLSLGQLYDRH